MAANAAASGLSLQAARPPAPQAAPAPPPAEAPQPPPPDRPFARLFQNLGADFASLGKADTIGILGGGGFAAVIASYSDDRVDQWTLDHPAPSVTAVGRVGGDGWTMAGAAVGTWVMGRALERPLLTHVGSDLIRAQVLNGVMTRALKIVVDRSRPSGGGHAFPSGHASASFVSAGVLHQHFGWKGGVPAYAAASFVAWTRVRDRAHWVSDVVFGAALGLASARAVTRGHDSRAWTVTPVAMPGGGGILFTRR
jgi:membrane-associated phospholipid phosphatase